jgi:hypothetical protein|tara:strand:- start:9 stop:446 length:438 start_codon:yes stop_codon:yes gene_type:complete
MEISIFDFDNTLVKTPYPESIEYMDQDESLDENKWTFNPNEEIDKIYKELPSSNLKVLLTNRIDVVKDEVVELLEKRGITFDEHMFIEGRDGDRSKGERLRTLLKKYPKTRKVSFWDDKQKHIDDMYEKAADFNNINFNFNLVKQ